MNDREYFITLGMCIQRLRDCVSTDIFDNLSKHNPWFDSEHELEADKLDELRMTLSLCKEEILHVISLIEPKDRGD